MYMTQNFQLLVYATNHRTEFTYIKSEKSAILTN